MVATSTQVSLWFTRGHRFPSRTEVSKVGRVLQGHKPGTPLTPKLKERLLEARRVSWSNVLTYMPTEPWGNCEFTSSNNTVVKLNRAEEGTVTAISGVPDRRGCYHFVRASSDRPDLYFVAGLNRSGKWVWLEVQTELAEGGHGFDTWDYNKAKTIFYHEVTVEVLVENLGEAFSHFWRALSEYVLHWVKERKRLLEMAEEKACQVDKDDTLMLLYFGPQDGSRR